MKLLSKPILFITVLLAALTLVVAVQDASSDDYGKTTPAIKRQVTALVYKHFGRGWVGRGMLRCVARESGYAPTASNWRDGNGGSHGLLQINGIWAPGGYATRAWIRRMYVPRQNILMGLRVYRAGLVSHGNGFWHWGGGC